MAVCALCGGCKKSFKFSIVLKYRRMQKLDNLVFEKHFKESGFHSQRRYPNEQAIQFLASHYFALPRSKRKHIKVLDLGCGSGANLWMIAKEGFDAYGIDISATGIRLCRTMLKQWGVSAALKVGNMRALPYEDSYFDAVVDVLSLEHTTLEGHQQAFKEIFRTLKPGGSFFSWHLGSKSISFIRGGGKKLDSYTRENTPNKQVPYPNNGITCFIPAPLAKKMLTHTGFVDISIERVTRTYKQMTQVEEYFAISARKP